MKKYSLSVLFFALCMLVTAAGAAWIEAPGGVLAPESTGVFPVSAGGLTDAQGVHFNLTFDGTLLSVESVSASSAITGSNVTANIDNEGGWVQVAVTNTEGITVNETWPLTPLVDITFRSTTNEGASAIEFAGTPTYSQGGDFMPEEFWTNFGRIKVGDPATIRAPSGTLAYGESRTFAVGVNNLTGATQIWFELMYDGSHLVIDDIAPTLPSAVITGAFANNGIYEFEPTALESVPEEVRLNLQQYHGSNLVWVELEIPGGLTTTGYTDVVDITFRPTNLTGTGDLDFYYHCTYQDENESTQLFDLQVPGQIVTNGGGSYPVLGEFKAPSGTVDTGSQKVLPLMVRSLNNAEEAYVWAEWNSTVINATSLSLSATARDAGVTLEGGDVYSYVYDNISVGYLYAYVGNLTRLNTASWTPLLDLAVRANATSGRIPVNISGSSSMIPRENVSIAYPPASLENGLIILDSMPVDAMQIGLGDVGAAKGQTTRALLTIRNASAIGAGSLDLTYDPAVVTVDAVHFASPWEGASNINNTNGKARLAYFSSSGYGQSGDVPVCTVTLRATGEPGDISPLNITVDQLIDDGGKDITSAARPLPGEFQVLYPDIPDPVRYRDAGGLYKGILSGNTLYFGEEGLNLTCLGSVQRLVHYTNFSAGTVDAVIYVPDCRSFDPVAGGNLTPGRYYAWGSDGILGGRPWVEIREPCTGLDVLLGGTNTSVDGTSLTRNAVLDFALENNLEGLHTTPAAIAMDIEVTMPGGGRLVRFGGVDLRGIPVNASTVYARGISLNDTNPGTYTARAVWPSASDFAGKGYNSNTVSFEIAMNTTPPIVGFMANVTSGPSPLTVRFTDTSTGSPTNWFWSFGDGSFSLEQHPIHTYTAPGTYNVSLTVTNAAGSNTTTRAGYITVSRAPGQGILWDVPLSITSGTFNRTMTLGSAESATRGFDAELDLPAPPEPPGTSESAYFTCTDPTFGQLAADYKPPVDDANPEESWVLCIRSDDPVQVAWNTTLLAESVLSLTWDDGTNTIAMKTTNGTTLPAGSYSISISASTARQMDLSLQEGWNLVSTPFNNATYTVPEGAILAIYGYNPSTKGYETVSGVTALVPGKACWIASARNCTVTMTGTPVIPVTAQLKQGWNLIGSTAGRNAFDGIAIVPTESWAMAFVYGYNPQTKVYVPITELQPGEGYWGAVTRDCTITLP